MGGKGIVLKEPASLYRPGEGSPAWLTLEPKLTLEVIVTERSVGLGPRRSMIQSLGIDERGSGGLNMKRAEDMGAKSFDPVPMRSLDITFAPGSS